MSKISDLIQQLAGTGLHDEVGIALCSVVSVDEKARTCTCDTVTGKTEVSITANLMASVDDGLLYLPAVESQVLIMYSKNNAPVVVMYSELSKILQIVGDSGIEITKNKIQLNDGAFHGIPKVAELVERINALENDNNALKTVFNTWTPVANDGGAALRLKAATWYADTIVLTKQSDIENTKVTHGSSL